VTRVIVHARLTRWNLIIGRCVHLTSETGGSHGFAVVVVWRNPKDMAQIDNPAAAFDEPSDVVHDTSLGPQEKKAALDTWEQDARQLMTASNEGMPGPQEGLESDDHHSMADVLRAKRALGGKPQQKPAH
jgi:hypothetical protein